MWSNLSPQTSKIGTRQALTSLRSGLTSAATNLSKRYEEMTAASGQSPAPTEPELDQDRVSQCSNDSRRQSETVQVDGIPQGEGLTRTLLCKTNLKLGLNLLFIYLILCQVLITQS